MNETFRTIGTSAETDGINSPIKKVENLHQINHGAVEFVIPGSNPAQKVVKPISGLFGTFIRNNAA